MKRPSLTSLLPMLAISTLALFSSVANAATATVVGSPTQGPNILTTDLIHTVTLTNVDSTWDYLKMVITDPHGHVFPAIYGNPNFTATATDKTFIVDFTDSTFSGVGTWSVADTDAGFSSSDHTFDGPRYSVTAQTAIVVTN